MSAIDIPQFAGTRLDRIPGPSGYPLVGILPLLRKDPLRFFVDAARIHGDAVRLDLGPETVLMLNDPGMIQHVLQDNHRSYEKGKYYSFVKLLFGDGVFTGDGNVWHAHRRTAQPAFNGDRLSRMLASMVGAADEMVGRWGRTGPRERRIDIAAEMTEVTLDVVCRTLFSIKFDGRFRALHGAMAESLREIERRIWSPLSAPFSWPTIRNRKLRRNVSAIHACVDGILADRRDCPDRHDDFLSMIFASADPGAPAAETYESIRTQALGMLIAGHETTANALTWTWYLLSKHPKVERQLHAEVRDVLGDREPTLEDLKRLEYTQAVFEEAMRLYPPIWTQSRTAVEDDSIGGIHLPAGSVVMLCSYAVHRNARYWENPEGFDPDRFLPGGARSSNGRYAYFPFGGGPRTCLGHRFAMLEAKVILARAIQSYRLDLLPGCRVAPEPMITLRPSTDIPMVAVRR